MISNDTYASPTVADEVSSVIDDAQVIAKTLPATRVPAAPGSLKERMAYALDVLHGYVIRQPVQAMLIAAAGSAALPARR